MVRKILYTECKNKIVAAIEEDHEIKELHFHPSGADDSCHVGDIYVGRVKSIVPNINAAFIEVGDHVECYYSMTEKYPPVFTKKIGKKPLCIGDELLVQIKKEASKAKQPTVTCNLNITGQNIVLTSGNTMIGVSAKIRDEKRQQLLSFGKQFEGEAFGLVFRTNSKDASEEELQNEIARLRSVLERILTYGKTRTCFSLLYKTPEPYLLLLRDIRQDGLDEIVVDKTVFHGRLFQEVEDYLGTYQPDNLNLLRTYEDETYPMQKCYSLEHIAEEALRQKVWMKSGGFLVISPTEALTVIDVNTGKCLTKKKDYSYINKEAAKEAARQIRLRNLTGIIIIDFINMESKEDQDELMTVLQNELYKDPNPGKVIDITKLQLVEITRRKIHKTLAESMKD